MSTRDGLRCQSVLSMVLVTFRYFTCMIYTTGIANNRIFPYNRLLRSLCTS